MLTTTKTTLLVFASLTLATAAFGSDASDARRSIESAYKRIDAAVARKDSPTLLSFMKPDYKLTMLGRTSSKADMSRHMNDLFPSVKTAQTKTSIRRFSLTGKKATVVAQELGQMTAVNPLTHKLRILKTNSIFEEVWVKEKGHWLKQRTTNVQMQATVDGKPIKPVVAK